VCLIPKTTDKQSYPVFHPSSGVLFILVRKPYDIGDRIHVSVPTNETSSSGSSGWIVKDINLFTTTVVFGATNEVATYSNGSLASARIINAARSMKANLNFLLKFPINIPYEKLQVFKAAIEKFVKNRPRQWASFLAFRATRVEADLGFVEYIVVAQHRGKCLEAVDLKSCAFSGLDSHLHIPTTDRVLAKHWSFTRF
jgi:small-conductance mechanosensitive channel